MTNNQQPTTNNNGSSSSNNNNNNHNHNHNHNHNDEHVRVFDWRRAAMSKKKNPACCDGNQVMGGAGDKLIEA